MKKIAIAKILGLSTAVILLFSLVFSSYNGFFNVEKQLKKAKSELGINTLGEEEESPFNFEKEAPDEEDFDDKHEFSPHRLNFVKFDPVSLLSRASALTRYTQNFTLWQSLPRWLLVRHVLI